MSPDQLDENTQREHLLYRVGLMDLALEDLQSLETRTAHELAHGGLLQPVQLGDIPQELLAALADEDDSHRITAPPGPLLFVMSDDSRSSALCVADLLLHNDRRIRDSALSHFDRLMDGDESSLAPHTLECIRRNRAGFTSDAQRQWVPSAISIFDAIGDDFLLNLAGFNQSMHRRYQHGCDLYSKRLLKPTPRMVGSLQLKVASATEQHTEVGAIIAECVERSQSLRQLLDIYFDNLGHLPLAGEFSLPNAVSRWAEKQKHDVNFWEEIWSWANESQTPVARYHACSVFVPCPELVPNDAFGDLWQEIAGVLELQSNEEPTGPWAGRWRLLCDLARHYCFHLESEVPSGHGERIANAAWWMAVRVASAMGGDEQLASQVRSEVLRGHYILESEQIWRTAHPKIERSLLEYGTIFATSIWSPSLQSVIGPNLGGLKPQDMQSDLRKTVRNVMATNLLAFFPIRSIADGATYAFEGRGFPAAKAWREFDSGDEEGAKMFGAVIQAVEKVTAPESFPAVLGRLASESEADQMLCADVIRALAYAREIQLDLLWEAVAENDWRKQVLLGCNEIALDMSFDAMIEIAVQHNDKWMWNLPHYLALAYEEQTEDTERSKLLFAFTVLSSIAGDTVSGLERILYSPVRRRAQDDAKSWCETLSRIQENSPPWIFARLGAVLAVLRAP